MKLADKIAAVERAELECIRERRAAETAVQHLKSEIRRSATPLRILAGGFTLGVASGIGLPGSKSIGSAGGRFVTGPLFSMLLDSVLPGLLAGLTAAATAEDAVGTAVEEAVEETVPDAIDEAVGAAAETPATSATKPRKRSKRRVDAA